MSNIQEAIISELKQDATVYSKLWNEDTGVFYAFPLLTPEGKLSDDQDYFFTYTTINNQEDVVLDIQKPRFKFNCFARTYEQALALRDDICRIFNRKKGELGTGGVSTRSIISAFKTEEYELFDDNANLFYVTMNFMIIFKGDNE